jgi:predicted secreted protein
MNIGTMVAVYFVIWWVTLFMVLPFGAKSAHEMGVAVEKGNERGAPISPNLLPKVLINTVLAGIITALIWWAVNHYMVGN